MIKKYLVAISALFLLTSCLTNEAGKTNKAAVGTFAGGIAGALLGSTMGKGSGKSVAIATGAILGSFAGNAFGRSLDQKDLEMHNHAQSSALESNRVGVSSTWRNPDSGVSGSITPTKTYQNNHGEYCREYTQKIVVGGKTESGYGVACRQVDGSWKIEK